MTRVAGPVRLRTGDATADMRRPLPTIHNEGSLAQSHIGTQTDPVVRNHQVLQRRCFQKNTSYPSVREETDMTKAISNLVPWCAAATLSLAVSAQAATQVFTDSALFDHPTVI